MTLTRKEAIQILSTRDKYGVLCGYTSGVTEALDMAIDALSPRPTGEWTEKEVFNIQESAIEEWQSARCSECGKYHTTPYLYYFSNYNFCPCCGAKMVQGGDSE